MRMYRKSVIVTPVLFLLVRATCGEETPERVTGTLLARNGGNQRGMMVIRLKDQTIGRVSYDEDTLYELIRGDMKLGAVVSVVAEGRRCPYAECRARKIETSGKSVSEIRKAIGVVPGLAKRVCRSDLSADCMALLTPEVRKRVSAGRAPSPLKAFEMLRFKSIGEGEMAVEKVERDAVVLLISPFIAGWPGEYEKTIRIFVETKPAVGIRATELVAGDTFWNFVVGQ